MSEEIPPQSVVPELEALDPVWGRLLDGENSVRTAEFQIDTVKEFLSVYAMNSNKKPLIVRQSDVGDKRRECITTYWMTFDMVLVYYEHRWEAER